MSPCKSCGYVNKADSTTCSVCGDPLPGNKEQQERSSERSDPLQSTGNSHQASNTSSAQFTPGKEKVKANGETQSQLTSETTGRVSSFSERTEQTGAQNTPPTIIWAFRVDAQVSPGHSPKRYNVEMRGQKFNGLIREGDIVAFNETQSSDGILRLSKIHNLTTSSWAGPVKPRKVSNLLGALILGLFLLGLGFAIITGRRNYRQHQLETENQQRQYQQEMEQNREAFQREMAEEAKKFEERSQLKTRQAQREFENQSSRLDSL